MYFMGSFPTKLSCENDKGTECVYDVSQPSLTHWNLQYRSKYCGIDLSIFWVAAEKQWISKISCILPLQQLLLFPYQWKVLFHRLYPEWQEQSVFLYGRHSTCLHGQLYVGMSSFSSKDIMVIQKSPSFIHTVTTDITGLYIDTGSSATNHWRLQTKLQRKCNLLQPSHFLGLLGLFEEFSLHPSDVCTFLIQRYILLITCWIICIIYLSLLLLHILISGLALDDVL